MSKSLTKSLDELNDSIKSYVQTKFDLFKLSLLDKTTRITSFLFVIFVVLLFSLLIMGFAAATFAVWYGQTYGDYTVGLLLTLGLLVLIAALLIVVRKPIINTFVFKNLSKMLFDDSEEEKTD